MKITIKRTLAVMLTALLCLMLTEPLKAGAATDARTVLNSAPLSPVRTNYEPLDRLADKVLKKVTSSKMDTYEKVRACYDYLINNISYSGNIFNAKAYDDIFNKTGYKSEWDKKVAYYGYCALQSKKESCYGYSSAFVVLTRAIGLESYVMQGKTAMAKGGYGHHWWVNIKIDGKYYVFDPNVDDDIAKGGKIYYYRFCKPDSEVPGKYIYQNRKKDVSGFKAFDNGTKAGEEVKLNAGKATLYTGETKTLKASFTPADARPVWKSSDKKTATVSRNGKVTAKKPGTAYITVTAGKASATCKVVVKKPYIKLNRTKLTLRGIGKTSRLKASVSRNYEISDIKWKSSNKKAVRVNKNGQVEAVGKGSAVVTARIGNVKAVCKVTVKP